MVVGAPAAKVCWVLWDLVCGRVGRNQGEERGEHGAEHGDGVHDEEDKRRDVAVCWLRRSGVATRRQALGQGVDARGKEELRFGEKRRAVDARRTLNS